MAGLAADGLLCSRPDAQQTGHGPPKRGTGAGGVCNRPPSIGASPRAPVGVVCATNILGHLKHHLRLKRPQELWMVVCEVPLTASNSSPSE